MSNTKKNNKKIYKTVITLITIIILLISIYYGIVFRNNFINWIIIIFLTLLNIHNLKDKSVQYKK